MKMFAFMKKKEKKERSSFEEAPEPGNSRMIEGKTLTGSSNDVVIEVDVYEGNSVRGAIFPHQPETDLYIYMNGKTYVPESSFDMSKSAEVKKWFDTIPYGRDYPDSITGVTIHSNVTSKIVIPYTAYEKVGETLKPIEGSCLTYVEFGKKWDIGRYIEFTKNNGEIEDFKNGHIRYTLTMKKINENILIDIMTTKISSINNVSQEGLQVVVNGESGKENVKESLKKLLEDNSVFKAYNIALLDVDLLSGLSEEDRLKIEKYKNELDLRKRTMMSHFKKKNNELDLEEIKSEIKLEKKMEKICEKTEKDD